MKKRVTRLTALLCAAAILLCSLPMQALAAEFQLQTTYEDSLPDELPVQDEPVVPEEPESSEESELPEQPEADADASAEPEAAPEAPAVSVLSTGNKSGDFTYSVLSDNTAQITGYSGSDLDLTIPAELDGYAVSSIGYWAFRDKKTICSVYIPDSVTTISEQAFRRCIALRSVRFPANLKTIGAQAFQNCSSLEAIEFPDCVETIGAYAFGSCSSLTSANFPQSWKSVPATQGGTNASPFAGSAKLTGMTVPEGVTVIPNYAFESSCLETVSLPSTLTTIQYSAFDNVKTLQSVDIPDNVTTINMFAFRGCTALQTVQFPANLQTIGAQAFQNCSSLETIELPDCVETIGAYAFGSCSSLTSANFPQSWKSVPATQGGTNASPFAGSAKLTGMTVPEGVTAIPSYAFSSSSLESVSLPSTLTSIGAYAFMNCKSLTYVEPVDGLQSIGREAFSGCTRLKLFHLTDSVTSFGQNIFYNCKNLTVECAQHSFAAIYCIDSGLPVHLLDGFTDRDSFRLSRDKTYYIANTVSALASGLISMNLEYGYKPGMESGVTNQSLTIRLPSSAKLLERTLRLNGAVLTSYTLQDTLLTIPLTEMSGRLSFSLQPTGSGSLTTYAVMNYQQGGSSKREVVGVLNDTLSTLTVYADETVNTAQVTVSGIGPAGADVELSVNGSFACIAHCSKGGTYRTTILLPDPQEYAPYVISAKLASSSGEALTASCEVTYAPAAPALQNFTMDYNGKTYDVLSLGKKKPVVTFVGKPFFFSIQFSNPEQIDRVYVCSSRSNVVKRMEAVWNESTGCYEANGWFDPNNHNYVPGTITV